MIETDKFIFFYGGIYSNFKESPFILEGQRFNNVEQYFHYSKALLFEDHKIAKAIADTKDPVKAKKLGRKVKAFDPEIWSKYSERIMMRGLIAKFTQTNLLYDILSSDEDKPFVEASPVDCIWGIGLSEDNDAIFDPQNWRGENKLGYCLSIVRSTLRNLYSDKLREEI